jgi:hypothetical protein
VGRPVNVDADRAIVGFPVVFDEPSVDGRPADRREDYEPLASFAEPLPLWINHHPAITPSGLSDAGRVMNFAVVDGRAPIPAGVVCLAEVADNDVGRSVLSAVARGQLWGLSLGGDGRPEISLTNRPAFTNCRVVGYGAAALTAWELLTATPDDAAQMRIMLDFLGQQGRPGR